MADQADPDAVLMLRVKRGDRAAFAALVEKYKQQLFNFVFRTLRDEIETEDVAQNTFLQVWKSRARYQRTAKFTTWLFTIARNLCLNEIRRRSRHPAESIEEAHAEHEDQPRQQYEIAHPPRPRNAQGKIEALSADRRVECLIYPSLLWLPSQNAPVLECLQPHHATFLAAARSTFSGAKPEPLCAPSQNGWFLDLPQVQK